MKNREKSGILSIIMAFTGLASSIASAKDYALKCEFTKNGIYHQLQAKMEGDLEGPYINHINSVYLVTEFAGKAQITNIEQLGGSTSDSAITYINDYSLGEGLSVRINPEPNFSEASHNELTKENTYSFVEIAKDLKHNYHPEEEYYNNQKIKTFYGDSRFSTAQVAFDVFQDFTVGSPNKKVTVAFQSLLFIHLQKNKNHLSGKGLFAKGETANDISEIVLGNHLTLTPKTSPFDCETYELNPQAPLPTVPGGGYIPPDNQNQHRPRRVCDESGCHFEYDKACSELGCEDIVPMCATDNMGLVPCDQF